MFKCTYQSQGVLLTSYSCFDCKQSQCQGILASKTNCDQVKCSDLFYFRLGVQFFQDNIFHVYVDAFNKNR